MRAANNNDHTNGLNAGFKTHKEFRQRCFEKSLLKRLAKAYHIIEMQLARITRNPAPRVDDLDFFFDFLKIIAWCNPRFAKKDRQARFRGHIRR